MSKEIIPQEILESKIIIVRGHKVMLDRDLAVLYGVSTGALNQAVTRNLSSFPSDFMFQLAHAEVKNWISQIVTSNHILRFQFGPSKLTGENLSPVHGQDRVDCLPAGGKAGALAEVSGAAGFSIIQGVQEAA